ncbi:MAG TPA: hypothetical protein VLJ15_06910 [Gammaproteobacteria bacterium]|nr:hypothetical protein [Gammaproteobacteria bacterium]
MEQTIGGQSLSEKIEKAIDLLIEMERIKPFESANEKATLIDQVKDALEAAFTDKNNNAPRALLMNESQMGKILLLVISDAIANKYNKDPAFASVVGIFKTGELGKALFDVSMKPEESKKLLTPFLMTLTPKGPGQRKTCEELAELILQQKYTFGDEEKHDVEKDQTLKNKLDNLLENYFANMKQYNKEEYNEMQAYGAPRDGTSLTEMGPQLGNTMSMQDADNVTQGKGGYVNIDNETSNINMSGEVRTTIEGKEKEMGLLDAVCNEMEQALNLSRSSTPRYTPPTRT